RKALDVVLFGNPAPLLDQIALHVAGERDRAAEAERPKPEKVEQELPHRARHGVGPGFDGARGEVRCALHGGRLVGHEAAHSRVGVGKIQLWQLSVDRRYVCSISPRMADGSKTARDAGWLLLIHQIPPKPNYFRVKIWRRLQRLGAVGIKNSVYALPSSEPAQEDLNWVLREIVEGGGDASLVEARLIEGLNDEQVKEMFRAARDSEYMAVADEARELARDLPRKGEVPEEKRGEIEAAVARLQKRVADIAAIDFFDARSRETVDGLLKEIEEKLAVRASEKEAAGPEAVEKPRGATWVTRTGIHVDRMASAWLIRRFI